MFSWWTCRNFHDCFDVPLFVVDVSHGFSYNIFYKLQHLRWVFFSSTKCWYYHIGLSCKCTLFSWKQQCPHHNLNAAVAIGVESIRLLRPQRCVCSYKVSFSLSFFPADLEETKNMKYCALYFCFWTRGIYKNDFSRLPACACYSNRSYILVIVLCMFR
jgi:hypothetical protein